MVNLELERSIGFKIKNRKDTLNLKDTESSCFENAYLCRDPLIDIRSTIIQIILLIESILNNNTFKQKIGFNVGQISSESVTFAFTMLNTCKRLLETSKSDIVLFEEFIQEIIELFNKMFELFFKLSEFEIDQNENFLKEMEKQKYIKPNSEYQRDFVKYL